MEPVQSLPLRQALLPLVGHQGYRRVLTALYDPHVLRSVVTNAATLQHVVRTTRQHGMDAVTRQETMLESDSKSRIYLVRTHVEGIAPLTLVVKWYEGARQQRAAIEATMNTYFRRCLAPKHTVVPILTVVPVSTPTQTPLSLAVLPYCGDETLYDRLHRVPRHSVQTQDLLARASETLAYTQVLGRVGYEKQAIHLKHLRSDDAGSYFLQQIDRALLHAFAASGQPLPIGQALREQFAPFATILAKDSCTAGLYYRGINPRNIMLVDEAQVEIDFEQDSLRSRCIDIVSLLENGLEMTDWDPSVDYPAFAGQLPVAEWQQQRQRAQHALARCNYLSAQQVDTLTGVFLEMTCRLEQEHLSTARTPYSHAEQRLLLETTRLFRHLQYIGYCKRNEEQAHTANKRLSSRCRQHVHALWAKVALDSLLYPDRTADACLPQAQRPTAMALRRTLDQIPLPSLGTA